MPWRWREIDSRFIDFLSVACWREEDHVDANSQCSEMLRDEIRNCEFFGIDTGLLSIRVSSPSVNTSKVLIPLELIKSSWEAFIMAWTSGV